MKIEKYTEEQLQKERMKLLQIDLITLVEYIQTSIEILMNLKSEEAMYKVERDKKMRTSSKPVAGPSSNLLIPETPDDQTSQKDAKESDLPPSEYEKMLQKLEGEVRNHIKIEQQLKLHIECIQDKLEDAIKEKDQISKQRMESLATKDKAIKEMEAEVEKQKAENEKMLKQIEQLNKEVKELKMQMKENQKRSVSTLINAINEKSSSTLGQHNYVVP